MAPFASVGTTEAGRMLVEDTRRQIRWRKRGGCALTVAGGLALSLAWMLPILVAQPERIAYAVFILPVAFLVTAVAVLPVYALWGVINRVTFEAGAARLALSSRALRDAVVQAPPELEGDALYAFIDAQLSGTSRSRDYGRSL